MLRLKGLALLLLTSLFLLVSLTLSAQTDASAQPQLPRFVRFSGAIASSSASVVGVTFSLYTSDQGGTPLWVETQNVSVDASGRYSVLLGAATRDGLPSDVFTSNEARWIGVKVDGQPELPRVLLVSVPYALKAGDAETLGGKPLSAFLLAPETSSSVTDPAVASTVTAGTATTAQSSRVALPRTASGAQNYVAKFDATGANLINSSLFDNGNVGIGTSSPGATLEVDNVSSTGMNAVTTNANLTNNSPLTGQVTSAMNLNIYDFSTAANLSKQTLRVGYIRTSNATGNVTAFDTLFTASPSINGDAPYQLRGINVESPNVASGKTLNTWIGAYFTAPGGAGTISNRYALVTEPGSGNVGIGTTNPSNLLTVNGTIQSTSGGFMFPDGSQQASAGVTNVSLGAGLTGGGAPSGGTVTISPDTTVLQKRVTGTCASGMALGAIGSDGSVTCNTVSGGGGSLTFPFSGSGADSPTSVQGVFKVTDTATGPTPPSNGPPAANTIPTAIVGVAAGSNIVAGVAGLSAQSNGVPLVAINTSTTGADVPVVFAWSQATSGGASIFNGQASSPNASGIDLSFTVTPSDVIKASVGTSPNKTQIFYVDGSGNVNANGSIQASGSNNSMGSLTINGTLNAMTKNFKIDDPLDPAKKWLYHTSIESPDMKNLYDGVVTLDSHGQAWVTMPEWFQALNRDFRYQLTAIGAAGPKLYVAQEISGNRFKIAGGKRGMKVSWQVTGIRQDAWATDNRTPIVVDKVGTEVGQYYHPKLVTPANSPDANAALAPAH